MHVKDAIQEMIPSNDREIIVVGSELSPIVEIKRSCDGAFLAKNGKYTYDITSEKIHITTCLLEDWLQYHINQHLTDDQILETLEFQTEHAIAAQKANYRQEKIDDCKEILKRLRQTPKKLTITLNLSKQYMLLPDAMDQITKLDHGDDLPIVVDGHPLAFPEIMEIYWDGYGRTIKNGKFQYGGASSKCVLHRSSTDAWMDVYVVKNELDTFEKVLTIFDFDAMPAADREAEIHELKEYYDAMAKYFKEDIERVREMQNKGRKMMCINLFGPMIVPEPLGSCGTCDNYDLTIKKCTLSAELADECTKIINGMKHWKAKGSNDPVVK